MSFQVGQRSKNKKNVTQADVIDLLVFSWIRSGPLLLLQVTHGAIRPADSEKCVDQSVRASRRG